MNRKSKALGLVLFAAFSLSAVTASGASAAGERFHSDGEHTILDFTQDGTESSATGLQTFTTTAGQLSCTGVEANVTLTGKTLSEITAVPVFTNCNKREGADEHESLLIHVQMTSCDYLLTSEKSGIDAPVHIRCSTPGDHIHLKATFLGTELNCLTIPSQTPTGGGLSYHNIGASPRTLTIEATVTGVEYTEKGVCGSAVANDGIYTGNVLVRGTNTEGKEVDTWWE